jgi:hypothetical protein
VSRDQNDGPQRPLPGVRRGCHIRRGVLTKHKKTIKHKEYADKLKKESMKVGEN